jgi:hypothetical protein
MKHIFESAGTGLQAAAPDFATWISAQVELVKAHCAPEERPHLRAYRLGHEYLACDYPSLSITIRIDPDAMLRVQGPITDDIFVSDMTDALTLISVIEATRQGSDSPDITLGTFQQ